MSSTCPHNMASFRPLAAEIDPVVGHPWKFQRVSRLGSVTARHLVLGVSQTLRRWTGGAIRNQVCDQLASWSQTC